MATSELALKGTVLMLIADFKSEWRAQLRLATVADFASEYLARLNWNPQSLGMKAPPT
jgi:hypothetical protein